MTSSSSSWSFLLFRSDVAGAAASEADDAEYAGWRNKIKTTRTSKVDILAAKMHNGHVLLPIKRLANSKNSATTTHNLLLLFARGSLP
jgi:hypothetical protein